MTIYVDFDGVIFDSETPLFEGYHKLEVQSEKIKLEYIQNIDWNNILDNCKIINDGIEILKRARDDIAILTKIHSMENEGTAKIKKLRNLGITSSIYLAPYTLKKTDIVNPRGNILIDDTVHNLNDWSIKGGISIFFNKDGNDIDGWHQENKIYRKIKRLDEIIK